MLEVNLSCFQFNKIIVIESLDGGDRKTGLQLFDDLEFVKVRNSSKLETEFKSVSNKSDFLFCIDELITSVELKGVYPVLHIDAHGNKGGVNFSEDGHIEWYELLEKLSKLNILMRGNLLVVLASCYGARIIHHISTVSRAPFWGVIAPHEKTYSENVYTGLNNFYNAICSGSTSSEIISALNASRSCSDLKLFTAELLFVKATQLAVSEFQDRASLMQRIKSMPHNLRGHGGGVEKSKSQLKTDFISAQKKKFEEDLEGFLMVDLFPENVNKISKVHNPWSLLK